MKHLFYTYQQQEKIRIIVWSCCISKCDQHFAPVCFLERRRSALVYHHYNTTTDTENLCGPYAKQAALDQQKGWTLSLLAACNSVFGDLSALSYLHDAAV
jgi:hypothetical protein